jgi:hypothetical protein
MTFLYLIRRTHLYLGLFLLPWVVMFGASSYPINHTGEATPAVWTRVAEEPFNADVPPQGESLRPLGEQMMAAAGLSGAGFYVNRPNPRQVNVNHPNFLHPTRITYQIEEHRLVAERRAFNFRQSLTGMHTRGGYNLGGFWDAVWAVFVDVVSVALVLWIITGLIMWWKLPGTGLRRWGWLALVGGAISFGVLIATL